ncbi:conserved hypothetical protein [Crenothrix polyspora]|uniref:Addiction module antitoxin RelB n=1 Tax=Crenothrix polyspora TaxID=360316 RepID=A0A1R4HEH7_9GAMM|nr:addiction module protein [Crenothrix polyspora]SJM94624.1 conserved hypothetical protein [Crenothrix polyspora]
MDISVIEQEALHLSVSARAELAHKLLLSLDNMSESEVEEAWLDEAERRAGEIDRGIVQLVSSGEVSRKARYLLK